MRIQTSPVSVYTIVTCTKYVAVTGAGMVMHGLRGVRADMVLEGLIRAEGVRAGMAVEGTIWGNSVVI